MRYNACMSKPLKKKNPSDYPIFAFRLGGEEKEELMELVDVVLKLKNKGVKAGNKVYRKNDVIFEALVSGLYSLKEKSKR